MQTEVISSWPMTLYLGEETNTFINITSFQVVVDSGKVPLQPSLLQTKQPQFPQLLLIRLVLRGVVVNKAANKQAEDSKMTLLFWEAVQFYAFALPMIFQWHYVIC